MNDIIGKIIVSEAELNEGIDKAAKWMDKQYDGKLPILIGILKGCVPFMASLTMKMKTIHQMDFMVISSYEDAQTNISHPKIVTDLSKNIKGRHVVLVEDIIDTGNTISAVLELLKARQPASLKVITLLDKPEGRKVKLDADYSCFKVPKVFIVGFGLDYKDAYRNLPYVGQIKDELIEKE